MRKKKKKRKKKKGKKEGRVRGGCGGGDSSSVSLPLHNAGPTSGAALAKGGRRRARACVSSTNGVKARHNLLKTLYCDGRPFAISQGSAMFGAVL